MRAGSEVEASQVELPGGGPQLPGGAAVHEHGGQGVQVLDAEGDAAADPARRDGDLALVPGGPEFGEPNVLPAGMPEEGLGLVLQVVGDPGPGAGDLEVSPAVRAALAPSPPP